jgi:4'-phosphopantetheinyl transferase
MLRLPPDFICGNEIVSAHDSKRKLPISLGNHEIHIWRLTLDSQRGIEKTLTSLTDKERIKAKSFSTQQLKRRFAFRRVARRMVLGWYLNLSPTKISIRQTDHQKPHLDSSHASKLQFNSSHSDELALIAVSESPVGIDVEKTKPLQDLENVAKRILSPKEHAAWSLLTSENKVADFYKYWTAKEACIKFTGEGLSRELGSLNVEIAPEQEPVSQGTVTFADQQLSLFNFQASEGFASTICTKEDKANLVFIDGTALIA